MKEILRLVISLGDISKDIMYLVDSDLNIIWANKKLEEEGFKLEKIKGRKTHEVFKNKPELCDEFAILEAFNTGKTVREAKNNNRIMAFPVKDENKSNIPISNIRYVLFVSSFQQNKKTKSTASEKKEAEQKQRLITSEYHTFLNSSEDITERKKAEDALKESEKTLFQIVQGNPIATFVIDKNHKILFWNKACEILTGKKAESLIGTNRQWLPFYKKKRPVLADIIVDGINDKKIKEYYPKGYKKSESIKGGYESEVFFPYLGKNGKWLFFTAGPILDKKGKIVGAIETLQDISGTKNFQKELQKFASIIDHSTELVNLATLDGKMCFINEAGSKMLGISEEEVQNYQITEVITKEYLPKVKKEVLPTLMKEGKWEGDLQYRNVKTEKKTDVHAMTFLISNPETGAPQYLTNISVDITERKLIEKIITKSELRYKALFESSFDALMTLEPPDWKFTSANKATVQMFRVNDEKQFITLGPWNISPKFQPDGQLSSLKSKKEIMKAMSTGSSFFEWTHKRYKGEDFPATVLLTRTEINGKQVLQATVRDITEQKKRDEFFISQNELLSKFARSKSLKEGDLKFFFKEVVKNISRFFDVERVSLWYFEDNDTIIREKILYENSKNKFSSGEVLQVKDYPFYFKALFSQRAIDAHDAKTDKRTSEFTKSYLNKLNIASLLDSPIRIGNKLMGIICMEHVGKKRRWSFEEQNFLSVLTDFMSNIFESDIIKKSEEELKKEKELSEKIIETAPLFIVGLDVNANILIFNEGAESMSGYKKEEVIGKKWFDVFIKKQEKKRIKYIFKKITKKNIVRYAENYILTKEGKEKLVAWYNNILTDKKNNIRIIISMGLDITEKNLSEKRFQILNNNQKNKVEELERFQKLTIGREMKMIELKNKIEELENKAVKGEVKK